MITKVPEPVPTPAAQPVVTKVPEPVPTPAAPPVVTKVPEPSQHPLHQPVVTKVPEPVRHPLHQPVVTKVPEPVPTPAAPSRLLPRFRNPSHHLHHNRLLQGSGTVPHPLHSRLLRRFRNPSRHPLHQPVVQKVPEPVQPAAQPVVTKVPTSTRCHGVNIRLHQPVVTKVPEPVPTPAAHASIISQGSLASIFSHGISRYRQRKQLQQHLSSSPSIPVSDGKRPNYLAIGILIMAILPILAGLVIVVNIYVRTSWRACKYHAGNHGTYDPSAATTANPSNSVVTVTLPPGQLRC